MDRFTGELELRTAGQPSTLVRVPSALTPATSSVTLHLEELMSIKITIKPNGPYLVQGEFTLVDEAGNEIQPVKKALCRCGASVTKPYCDGTHSKIGFQAANAAVEEKKG